MHVVRQVLDRATATAEKVCNMDFLIVQDNEAEPGLTYRLEWRVHDRGGDGRGLGAAEGSFAAESIADAEDMGFQYFGIEAHEWTAISDSGRRL